LRVVFDLVRARYGDLVRRRFEIALVLSLALHGVAMWKWFPHEPLQLTPGDNPTQDPNQQLSLRIVPSQPATPQAPPQVMREAPPAPAPPPRPRAAVPRPIPRPTPPVIATPAPAPAIVPQPAAPTPPPVAVVPAPPAPPPPVTGDLASYIEQRRRARGETGNAPANVDSDSARRDRAIAQNLASLSQQTFGDVPQNGGGTFQIRRLDYDDAQFSFYGWSKEINKRTFQVIDVRKGSNENISIAVVRKIISIIREYEPGDFRWHSLRLSRDMTLSARPEDNADLEKFMMLEFFSDSGRAR
jgi:outer membrane biosynthesis protein TonB